MGTDIHLYVETRPKKAWKKAGAIFPNRWYPKYKDQGEKEFVDDVEIGRSYDLFGILAEVRGHCPGLPSIDGPRGLPKDISVGLNKKAVKYFGEMGYHSFSWLTLQELVEYRRDHAKQINKNYKDTGVYFFFFEALDDVMKFFPDLPVDRIRFVFWFDS